MAGVRVRVLGVLLLLCGCSLEVPEPEKEGTAGCRACHGSLDTAAPPTALDGSEDPTSIGVGAHIAHLSRVGIAPPQPAATCIATARLSKAERSPCPFGHWSMDHRSNAEVATVFRRLRHTSV
jgi:hypothetical protein